MGAMEGADRLGNEMHHQAVEAGDAHAAGPDSLDLVDLALEPVVVVEGVAHMTEEKFAGRRQAHAARQSLE